MILYLPCVIMFITKIMDVIILKIQESAENYLEAILVLGLKNPSVRSVDIAAQLNFSKPSVSVAMKNLRENGYINMSAEGRITLTDKGREIAENVYEKHTLLTKWLVFLGVDPEIAAADACKMEHVISKESFEAIKNHVKSSS